MNGGRKFRLDINDSHSIIQTDRSQEYINDSILRMTRWNIANIDVNGVFFYSYIDEDVVARTEDERNEALERSHDGT